MLKVNRKVEYGLVALKHMQNKPKGELTSVREVCKLFSTPFDPVAHVLRILNANDILNSEQGAHGGYRLTGDLSTISFARFIEMIEGHLSWTDCTRLASDRCGIADSCNIVGPMHAFNGKLLDFLGSISLADLLNGKPIFPDLGDQPSGQESGGEDSAGGAEATPPPG